MTQTFESGYKSTLSAAVAPADTTLDVATAPTVTKGRIYLTNGQQEERISFTGVSSTTLTGCTRNLSKTADPATAGTGLTWIAGTTVKLVAMHDQLLDKLEPDDSLQVGTIYATAAARDSALGGDGVATEAYVDIFVTADGLYYDYNLSTNQRESRDTGTTTPNASTTAAGKVEQSIASEHTAGTATGGTGAKLFSSPDVIQASIQSGEALYAGASAVGTDSYAVTMTPTLTAYTTGQRISFKADVANTGACTIDIDSLGVKNIKTKDGQNLEDSTIRANEIIELVYDGTDMIYQQSTKDTLGISIFGTGSDGDVTLNSGATVTLTQDMFYRNLTITNNTVLDPDGYKVYVQRKLTIDAGSSVNRDGNAGSNGTNGSSTHLGGAAATTLNQGSLNAEVACGAGGDGSNGTATVGTAGTASNPSYDGTDGAAGGAGGQDGLASSGDGEAGGAGGTGTQGAQYNVAYSFTDIITKLMNPASVGDVMSLAQYKGSASSGGGGGGDGAGGALYGGGGGGAGGNGGVVWIACDEFDNSGTVSIVGGAGGAGGAGEDGGGSDGSGGGGGGGGGNGGTFILIRRTLTALGTVTVTAGAAGTGGAGGTGATAGSSGANGTIGNVGTIIQITV